jgi:hypothetical protein
MRVVKLARLEGVPRTVLRTTVWASIGAILVALYQGWPGWAVVAMALAPWLPLFAIETRWLGRHYGWFALFYVLTLTQSGHVVEHISQMVQLHVLHETVANGVIGVLNLEWVHFGWNTWVFLAVIALVVRFRRNPWLWATLAFATWHEAEHVYLLSLYLRHGFTGLPGLLDKGGLIAGGLPILGPNLHFFYNVIETVPLIAGFIYQLRRTHDAWLERAFPKLSRGALARATASARARRFEPGEVIVREGDAADASFVIVRGELDVLRGQGVGEHPAVLGPGECFGEIGVLYGIPRTASVRGRSAGELIELDAATLKDVMSESPAVPDTPRQVVSERP